MIDRLRDPAPGVGRSALTNADEKPWLVVSDVHLGGVPYATAEAFHEFVEEATTSAAGLVINGDLFDLWYSYRYFVPRQHVRTMMVLADAVAAGLRVLFVAGNRDAIEWDSGALRDDVGLELFPGPVRLQLGSWNALVAHGDGVRPNRAGRARNDAVGGYRRRYRVLRNLAFVWCAKHLLPADTVAGLMVRFSRTPVWVARHERGESTGPKPATPHIERWAREVLAAQPTIDLVLAGHSHVPSLVEVSPGQYYVNSGDWVSHFSYVVLAPRGRAPELRVWPSRLPIDWSSVDDGCRRSPRRRVDQPAAVGTGYGGSVARSPRAGAVR